MRFSEGRSSDRGRGRRGKGRACVRAGQVPAAFARKGTAETEERYAAARAEPQKSSLPCMTSLLAGRRACPFSQPRGPAVPAAESGGSDAPLQRRQDALAGLCATGQGADAAPFSGKMRSLARPLCGRAEARAKGCEGCRATARTKGGRKRRGTGEPCRRRAFPTGRRAYAVGGRRVSLSSRAISSGVRRRRRNS